MDKTKMQFKWFVVDGMDWILCDVVEDPWEKFKDFHDRKASRKAKLWIAPSSIKFNGDGSWTKAAGEFSPFIVPRRTR